MTEIKIELPDTLSGLLRVAVNDAKLCEANPKFRLNMAHWVEASEEKDDSGNPVQCEVCMAGAVLVQRSGALLEDLFGYIPEAPTDTDRKLVVINSLRTGSIRRAYGELHDCSGNEWFYGVSDEVAAAVESAQAEIDGTFYGSCARWDSYEAAADILEAVGL